MNDWRGILWEMVSSEPKTAKESKTHRSGVYMHKIRPAKILDGGQYCPHCILRSFCQSHKKGEGMEGRERK